MKVIIQIFAVMSVAVFCCMIDSTTGASLADKYRAWQNNFKLNFPSKQSIVERMFEEATLKANQLANREPRFRTREKRVAVMLANLYSQEPSDGALNIYRNVNAQLRRDPSVNNVWTQYAILMEHSMDILCVTVGQCVFTVYRGTSRCDEISSDTQKRVVFQAFTSTTTNAQVAGDFANNCIFFAIDNAKGLAMDKFSTFPGEQEILLAPNSVFDILQLLKDPNSVRRAMERLSIYNKVPRMYVQMKMNQNLRLGTRFHGKKRFSSGSGEIVVSSFLFVTCVNYVLITSSFVF